jgi:hypothetical protein
MNKSIDQLIAEKVTGRECNIKTLNTIDTIDTKHYKTKNYETSSAFARDDVTHVKLAATEALPSSGLASLSSSPCSDAVALPQDKEALPPVNSAPPEFTYFSASLKNPTTLRRSLNLDFRLSTTPAGVFNKLVFSFTHSSRSREFFANIPKEYHQDWEYQQAWEYFVLSQCKDKWIGKGRPRGKFIKGSFVNSKLELGMAGVMEFKNNIYLANVWIEGQHQVFELSPTDNERYPFRYDSGSVLEKVEVLPRRSGWL